MSQIESNKLFDSWLGQIRLGFEQRNKQTFLTERLHKGPLLVQRPFYPEGPVCHVYLIHPPGGVVGGDQLRIIVDCREHTDVLLTTPAAGKFYRSNGKTACQKVELNVAEHAMLEWLPLETIMFDGTLARCTTRINLAKSSRFIAWEIVALGRPVCDEVFVQGSALINIEIFLEHQPLLIEKVLLDEQTIKSICGLAGQSMLATMFVFPAKQDDLELVRTLTAENAFLGVTLINGILVCRMLGSQAERIREMFISIWRVLRPRLNQRQLCIPRVWAT